MFAMIARDGWESMDEKRETDLGLSKAILGSRISRLSLLYGRDSYVVSTCCKDTIVEEIAGVCVFGELPNWEKCQYWSPGCEFC